MQHTQWDGSKDKEKKLSSTADDAKWIGFCVPKIIDDAAKDLRVLDDPTYHVQGFETFLDVYHDYQKRCDGTVFRSCFNLADTDVERKYKAFRVDICKHVKGVMDNINETGFRERIFDYLFYLIENDY
eukprot:31218_1